MPSVNDHDADDMQSPSPPDPIQHHTLRKMQPFQEPFVAQQPPLPDLRSANTGRSRATSRAPSVLHSPQPIKDAVNHAFDSSPVAQNQLDPELVRQVTEQVIKNLQQSSSVATPIASVQPQQTSYAAPPRPPPTQPVVRSSTQSSTDSIPQRYTPPSPDKRERREDDGRASPELVQSDTGSAYGRGSRKGDARTRDTPRPLHSDGVPGLSLIHISEPTRPY